MPEADVLVLAEILKMIMEVTGTMQCEVGSNQECGIFYKGIEWIVQCIRRGGAGQRAGKQ